MMSTNKIGLKLLSTSPIACYGRLFLEHIVEDITESPTFTDGVPKEGLRIEDVLVRIATLSLFRDKVKAISQNAGSVLFANDIVSRLPGLKGGRVWKEYHDRLLLRAVLKHGYGRWQAIVDDKDLKFQEVISQELNLPLNNIPVPGAPQAQNSPSGTSQAQVNSSGTSQTQVSASGVSQTHGPSPAFSQSNSGHVEAPSNQAKGTNGGNNIGANDTAARAQLFQDQSMLYHFREMQRRQVEFIKKRVLLLEKALIAEVQKEAEEKTNFMPNVETRHKGTCVSPTSEESNAQMMIDQLPQVDILSSEEIMASASDNTSDRLDIARLYNQMSKVVIDNAPDAVNTYRADRRGSVKLGRNLAPMETLTQEMNQIISPVQQPISEADPKAEADNSVLGTAIDTDVKPSAMDTESLFSNGTGDIEMEEKHSDPNIST
ncbi:hypothetical protein RD792_013239 [Penstemon davidsonii]|uniref:CHD subfamily II SANT-like domain-containing protein n=1 Tax=Penstemon davidsonii TaxID=160366 RepID=A0ABR0CSX4_9LAMI|nr:hypothetical protein RD792_013239 [Penstemon davidsonii]